jgi:hypothetical protein
MYQKRVLDSGGMGSNPEWEVKKNPVRFPVKIDEAIYFVSYFAILRLLSKLMLFRLGYLKRMEMIH